MVLISSFLRIVFSIWNDTLVERGGKGQTGPKTCPECLYIATGEILMCRRGSRPLSLTWAIVFGRTAAFPLGCRSQRLTHDAVN
jgi:hypothetical protein